MPNEAEYRSDAPPRLPRGSECQCMADGGGLIFTGETAFTKHWTKTSHRHPSEVGLVERERAAGPVWGWPSSDQNPRSAEAARQEGPITGSGGARQP